MKPIVYIASPYTKGDPCINAWYQMKKFNELLDDKLVVPFAPLVSHYLHTAGPRPYEDWIEYDLDLIRGLNFDACLRLEAINHHCNYHVAESAGADNEARVFEEMGLPVFYNQQDLYVWAADWPGAADYGIKTARKEK